MEPWQGMCLMVSRAKIDCQTLTCDTVVFTASFIHKVEYCVRYSAVYVNKKNMT